MLQTLAAWITATGISGSVMDNGWVWPAAEVLHFMGLSVLLGVAGLFDLRLIGFFSGVPLAALRRLMPWAMVGFAVNLFTGTLFFLGTPFQYVTNPAFGYKLLSLLAAGVNALAFERWVATRALAVDAGGPMPTPARVIGAASLVSWFAVLYWGRMLAFLGDAF